MMDWSSTKYKPTIRTFHALLKLDLDINLPVPVQNLNAISAGVPNDPLYSNSVFVSRRAISNLAKPTLRGC